MSIAAALSGFFAQSVEPVLEQLMASVDAYWQANVLLTKKAVGVTQRLMRLAEGLATLMEQFDAGKVMWRKRAPRGAKPPVAAEPRPFEIDTEDEVQQTRPQRQVFGLPSYYGWLAAEMPNVAVMVASQLDTLFKSEQMRALMLATPKVALMAGPVFRMFGLNDSVLLVPVGYEGPALRKNRRYTKPEPKWPTVPKAVSDYVPSFEVPPGYDEERDGRKPHPLRDPSWRYKAYENYRQYLYYYMERKPARL